MDIPCCGTCRRWAEVLPLRRFRLVHPSRSHSPTSSESNRSKVTPITHGRTAARELNTSIPSSMIPLLLLLPLTVPALASRDQTIGVSPGLLSKYAPSSGDKWMCLDGSKQISWKAVNDDYCDCKDGSDEPGARELSTRRIYH